MVKPSQLALFFEEALTMQDHSPFSIKTMKELRQHVHAYRQAAAQQQSVVAAATLHRLADRYEALAILNDGSQPYQATERRSMQRCQTI
jgi:hypothetical protein